MRQACVLCASPNIYLPGTETLAYLAINVGLRRTADRDGGQACTVFRTRSSDPYEIIKVGWAGLLATSVY